MMDDVYTSLDAGAKYSSINNDRQWLINLSEGFNQNLWPTRTSSKSSLKLNSATLFQKAPENPKMFDKYFLAGEDLSLISHASPTFSELHWEKGKIWQDADTTVSLLSVVVALQSHLVKKVPFLDG